MADIAKDSMPDSSEKDATEEEYEDLGNYVDASSKKRKTRRKKKSNEEAAEEVKPKATNSTRRKTILLP